MKFFAPLLVLAVLTGCVTDEERARQAQAELDRFNAHAHESCIEYGFKLGTTAYGECRMRFNEMRLQAYQAERARRAAIAGALISRPQTPIYTPAPTPSLVAPTRTHCYRTGNQVNCTSY